MSDANMNIRFQRKCCTLCTCLQYLVSLEQKQTKIMASKAVDDLKKTV